MEKVVFLLTLLQLLLSTTKGERILDRCSLAQEMEALNLCISRADLARWAYIADKGSEYKTGKRSWRNSDGSRNYGLFQISSKDWCKSSTGFPSKNICNVNCIDLIADNIKASVDCALMIQKQDGWKPWSALIELEAWGQLSVEDCFEVEAVGTNVNNTATEGGAGNIPEISPKYRNNMGQEFCDKDREF